MVNAAVCEVVATTKDRPAWLRARRGMLGASDVPAVLGLSPWRPAVEVWAEKTSRYEESPDDVTEAMELGTELEPALLAALARRTRCKVHPAGELLRSTRWPWLAATLDGLILAASGSPLRAYAGSTGSAEVKLAGAQFAGDWISPSDEAAGFVPPHYLPQVDTQLAVTGAPFAVFGALLGGRLAFRWCVVPRDDRRIDRLVNETGTWWEAHVRADVPPEPDGSERAADLLARLYPERGGIVMLDDELGGAVDRLREVKAQLRALEDERALLDQRLRLAIGSASSGELPGGRVVRLATVKRKGFSVEATEYRQLRLPKE